ncbi:MAG: hypothetical protein LUQ42_01130 [Methanomicrobiales archaeon]|jgi:hypothetical protein|nr:hypothetical protein [Methanomicrobiales archaeon]MDD1645693.1 hypothetical protein [Methanomicrobiales archaeon]MDD1646304.1 hypothetical protein [Methanomicrobiales archaeon]MDD1647862.1 hypothetical protein [Methanomicrobiales archaeon]
MPSKFGKGFVVNLMLLAKHFGQPPAQAWPGVADHMEEMTLPEQFKGTEVEKILEVLRKQVYWHQPGSMDREDAAEVLRTMNRLAVAIDRALGVTDPDTGQYD